MDHMGDAALTAPVRGRTAGKSENGIYVHYIEIRDRIAKSAPHAGRKHILEWLTPSTKIANGDTVIYHRAVQWNRQMP
jgi:hypothetical protein